MKIRIKNNQRKIAINKKRIAHLAEEILKIKGIKRAELSILFVGTRRIRALNKKYRRLDSPTDVLSFSMQEGKKTGVSPEILGDVVICPQIARKQAKIFKTDSAYEIYLYLTHAILHLLGYDDTSKGERTLMKKEEARILGKLLKDEKTKHYPEL